MLGCCPGCVLRNGLTSLSVMGLKRGTFSDSIVERDWGSHEVDRGSFGWETEVIDGVR